MTTLAEFTYQPGRSIDQISGILDNRRRMDMAESQFAEEKAIREKEFAETTRQRDEESQLKRDESRENMSLNRAKADQSLRMLESNLIGAALQQANSALILEQNKITLREKQLDAESIAIENARALKGQRVISVDDQPSASNNIVPPLIIKK